jgi:AcrR family transcriptional regulator
VRRDAVRNHHRILDAAREVLGESGAGASMEEIAARAGVGVGTVYRRFASKDALIDELLRLALEQLTEVTERALARTDGYGLAELLRGIGQSFDDHARYANLLLERPADPAASRRIQAAIGELTHRATAAGTVQPGITADDVLALIWAMRGLIQSPGEVAPGEVAPGAWSRFLDVHLAGMAAAAYDGGVRQEPDSRVPASQAPDGQVQEQYARGDIWARIESAIRRAGKDPDHIGLDDLAPLEEFHIGGRGASIELAKLAALPPHSRLLDVGAGLGGPARLLAARYECLVTALDLTPEYCRAAEMLNQATGLADLITVRQGSALDLPFADGEFDAVWTQHASMNIEDKPRLYAQIRRVLSEGGTFALHDVHAGPNQPILFPVPWADTPAISFLATAEQTRSLVTSAGFEVVQWRDWTAEAISFFQRQAAAASQPALGIGDYVPDFAPKRLNLVRNFEQDRLRATQAVFRAL